MTQNKRIVLNTAATYGRSMISVACGIFTARWVLMALGQVDFGLYGLIGSMVIFVAFLNIQFSAAIARYYAYSVGQAKISGRLEDAISECQSWFTTATVIHTVLPLILICVGYPIGAYAITHQWLNIPLDRQLSCLWVWRFVCLSTFVGMLNVPFQAMYTAKQYIAELTIYSLGQTLARTAFIYYMVTHPGDWLVKYGLGIMLIAIVPELLICIRACMVFPECRVKLSAILQFWRLRQVGQFAFWQGVGGVGFIASHQGMSILINQFFGARYTGGFSVSNTVAGEAASLTGALQGAFAPAITTACGAGDLVQMRTMAYRLCKVGTALTLMFAIPMALEIDEVLHLWLKDPPPCTSGMCVCTLAFMVIEKLTMGHILAVNAGGRVAAFQLLRGILRVAVIPLALVFVFFNFGAVAVTIALPISGVIVDVGDVYMARKYAGMDVEYWFRKIVCPIFLLAVSCCCVGCMPQLSMDRSFGRIVLTAFCTLAAFIPLLWFFVFSSEERAFVKIKLAKTLSGKRTNGSSK